MQRSLVILLSMFSISSAEISHTNDASAQACFIPAHGDIHFVTAPTICDSANFTNGFIGNISTTCNANAGAAVITPGGSYCLVSDSLGNLWSIQIGLPSEAALAPCSSSAQFNINSGCAATSPENVPALGPFGLILLLMSLFWYSRSRLKF